MAHPTDQTNAETRAAIRKKVDDVAELLINLASLTHAAGDTATTLAWSECLCAAERIRVAATTIIDRLAAAGSGSIELKRATRGSSRPAK
jgi:hypothetical protein